MDAPTCLVCNTPHWSTQPCPAMGGRTTNQRSLKQARLETARDVLRQAESVTETELVRQEPVRRSEPAVKQPVRQSTTEKSNSQPPVKQPADRKAYLRDYMRDYMRQRRAEARTTTASS